MREQRAAGVKYFKGNLDVPVITAIGEGKFADMIIKSALAHGVELVENEDFFEYEALLQEGKELPVELYGIVSSILVYLIKTNKLQPEDR